MFTGDDVVCFDIKMIQGKNIRDDHVQESWSVGSCHMSISHHNKAYASSTQRCCLSQGVHLLECRDTYRGDGWNGAYLEIFGQKYCNDFVDYVVQRRVFISGKKINFAVCS